MPVLEPPQQLPHCSHCGKGLVGGGAAHGARDLQGEAAWAWREGGRAAEAGDTIPPRVDPVLDHQLESDVRRAQVVLVAAADAAESGAACPSPRPPQVKRTWQAADRPAECDPPHRSGGHAAAWALVCLGAAALTFGCVLAAWSLCTARGNLAAASLPAAIGGLLALVVGRALRRGYDREGAGGARTRGGNEEAPAWRAGGASESAPPAPPWSKNVRTLVDRGGDP
jgi:hypothetical protein